MGGAQVYKTKQRAIIEKQLKNADGKHTTVDALAALLAANGECVGRTTVYRTLELMVKEGKVRKYTNETGEGACYQYVENAHECEKHFHLKCERCGKLIHVECESMSGLAEHIENHHGFKVNKLKTVLYGICGECLKND